MVTFTVNVKQKNPDAFKKILKQYKKKNDHILKVGYPKELVGDAVYPSVRDPENPSTFIKTETPPRIIDVVAVNEFGSESQKIPPRPFMKKSSKPTIKMVRREFRKLAKKLNEKNATPDIFVKFLQAIGPKSQRIFQKTLTDLREPANAQKTVEIKGSDNPLIDTGLMRQTLTYLVTKSSKSKGN